MPQEYIKGPVEAILIPFLGWIRKGTKHRNRVVSEFIATSDGYEVATMGGVQPHIIAQFDHKAIHGHIYEEPTAPPMAEEPADTVAETGESVTG